MIEYCWDMHFLFSKKKKVRVYVCECEKNKESEIEKESLCVWDEIKIILF